MYNEYDFDMNQVSQEKGIGDGFEILTMITLHQVNPII